MEQVTIAVAVLSLLIAIISLFINIWMLILVGKGFKQTQENLNKAQQMLQMAKDGAKFQLDAFRTQNYPSISVQILIRPPVLDSKLPFSEHDLHATFIFYNGGRPVTIENMYIWCNGDLSELALRIKNRDTVFPLLIEREGNRNIVTYIDNKRFKDLHIDRIGAMYYPSGSDSPEFIRVPEDSIDKINQHLSEIRTFIEHS